MSNNHPEPESNVDVAETVVEASQLYFVPGRGEIKANSLSDLRRKVRALKKKEQAAEEKNEVENGNN